MKEHTNKERFTLNLNSKTDKALIAYLRNKKSISAYLKDLVITDFLENYVCKD